MPNVLHPHSPVPPHPVSRDRTSSFGSPQGEAAKKGKGTQRMSQRRLFSPENKIWAERWSYRAHQKRLTHVTFQAYSTANLQSERNLRMNVASKSLRGSHWL